MTSRTELPAISAMDAQWRALSALNEKMHRQIADLLEENAQLKLKLEQFECPAITDAQSAISKWRVTPWDLGR